jgi:hypothetical protein
LEAEFKIGNPGKVMLHRKSITTTPGHHHFEEPHSGAVRVYPQLLKVAHFKWFEGVGQKYVDPALMAHHSDTWAFAAYDQFIQKNFFGWKHWLNAVKYNAVVQAVLRVFYGGKRAMGALLRRMHLR